MRVIAGQAKGKSLFGPVRECATRPITDRAKESLFNILNGLIKDARFLDLFAGTGSVGIEALSRGAEHATFVENSKLALKVIKRNLTHTQLGSCAKIIFADVIKFLAGPAVPFDIIFLAPPQYRELWSKALHLIDENPEWLAVRGLTIVQIDPSEYVLLKLSNLTIYDTRRYSNVMLCFFKKNLPSNTS